jgi:hypothetical protein
MQEPFVSLAGLIVPKLTKRVRVNRPDELMIEMLKLIELWCRQSARSTLTLRLYARSLRVFCGRRESDSGWSELNRQGGCFRLQRALPLCVVTPAVLRTLAVSAHLTLHQIRQSESSHLGILLQA